MRVLVRSFRRLTTRFSDLRGASFFTASGVAVNLATLVSGLLVYRWLPPYFMGIWQAMVLIQTYCGFLTLGIANGMNRELPYSLGKGDVETARQYAATTQFFNLGLATVTLVAFLPVVWLVSDDANWRLALATIGLIIAANFYYQYLLATFRAKADFHKLAWIQFFDAGWRLLSVALVYFFAFEGYCVRAILLVFVPAGLTFALRPMRVRPRLSGKALAALAKVGLPIFAFSYATGFAYSLPRLILLKVDTVETLGLYAPVVTLLGTMNAFFNSVRTYVYPKLAFRLGATADDKASIWPISLAIHAAMVAVALPIALAGWFAIPWVVEHFIPKYKESLDALNVGLLIIVFLGYRMGATILIALKSWAVLAVYVALYVALQFAMPALFLRWFDPLLAITWGQLAAAVLMVGVSLWTNYRATHQTPKP